MHAQLKKRHQNPRSTCYRNKFKLQKKAGKKLNLVLNNNAELSEVLPELSTEQTETVRNVASNMSVYT